MKINKMEAKAIEAQIDKLKTPIDNAEGKRTKGDESPSRRLRNRSLVPVLTCMPFNYTKPSSLQSSMCQCCLTNARRSI